MQHHHKFPINPIKKPNDENTTRANLDLHVMPEQKIAHTINALYTLPYCTSKINSSTCIKKNYSPVQAIIKAALNGQLEGIPFMKVGGPLQDFGKFITDMFRCFGT